MESFKENILQLLSSTGYNISELNSERLNFVESPFTSWFGKNISQQNCVTEEELAEFESLQENGEVLYGEELDEALQKYYDAGAIVTEVGALEEVKRDELEHAQHQLNHQKQLAMTLRCSLESLENIDRGLQQDLKNAQAQQICVLKNITAANTEFNNGIKLMKGTVNGLVDQIVELVPNRELSAEESSDTVNTSSLSVVSTFSNNKVDKNCKFICQMSLEKYNKQHIKFCKLLKDILMKRLNEVQQKSSRPHAQVLVQNIMDSLYKQKMTLLKLSGELAGVNHAIDKISDLENELQGQLWKPNIRIKLTEFEESSILNESETSTVENDTELRNVCWKWADCKVLPAVNSRMEEKIQRAQLTLKKLEELESIMKAKLAIDLQLCEKMNMENDMVINITSVYNKFCDWIEQRLEASKTRIKVMEENVQDFNDFAGARKKFVECLAVALNSDVTGIPEAFHQLAEHSHKHHQESVHAYRQQLQVQASVLKELYDFHFEEEEKRHNSMKTRCNEDHFDSVKQTLEQIACNIEEATSLCHTIRESKGDVV